MVLITVLTKSHDPPSSNSTDNLLTKSPAPSSGHWGTYRMLALGSELLLLPAPYSSQIICSCIIIHPQSVFHLSYTALCYRARKSRLIFTGSSGNPWRNQFSLVYKAVAIPIDISKGQPSVCVAYWAGRGSRVRGTLLWCWLATVRIVLSTS